VKVKQDRPWLRNFVGSPTRQSRRTRRSRTVALMPTIGRFDQTVAVTQDPFTRE
jgi:hypothetical protein